MISFIGAGPGAPDLITLRAVERLAQADVVIWAASLVNRDLLAHCRPGVEVHDSAVSSLEDIVAVFAANPEKRIVRLHSGDTSIYSAITEQIDWCVENSRDFEIVPGVSSMAATAAAIGRELTAPGVSQSLIVSRLAKRTAASVPDGERLATLASTGATMAVFLSAARPEALRDELLSPPSAFHPTTPTVLAHRVSWPDQSIVTGTIATLPEDMASLGATMTVMILVGEALAEALPICRSHVYDPGYSHSFRDASAP